MDSRDAVVAVKALVHGMGDVERGEFFEELRREYPTELGVAVIDASVEVDPVEETVDVMTLLSPEQKERAGKLISAMAEKFGAKPEDFSVLATETETGEQRFTVALIAGTGIYKGSWNGIFHVSSARNFMVKIGRHKVDTRSGMTLDVYKAMVEVAKAGNQTLADSPQLAEENGQIWGCTWLTGQVADAFNAQVVSVNRDGSVNIAWRNRDFGSDSFFRPAVVIE